MSRYIDANALKAWFFRPYSNEESYCNMDVAKAIDNAQTIDAVQVVRCKECIWRHDDSSPMWLPCMERETPNDWFCADGERRTE